MRLIKMLLFVLCAVFSVNCCSRQGSVLHDTDGNTIPVKQLQGKWIIVNYWADWCSSCVKEIPELNRFYQHNRDKNIMLYGVNYDRMPMNELKAAINRTHIAYPVVLDDLSQTWPLSGIDVLPVTFIVDPQGRVAKKILGANTEKSLLAAVYQLQLAEK